MESGFRNSGWKWSMVLAAVLLILLLTGCGSDGGNQQTAAVTNAPATAAGVPEEPKQSSPMAGMFYADDTYTLTILEDETGCLTRYKGDEKNVVIPARIGPFTVTAIGDEAFSYKDIESVVIPGTVKTIGTGAFRRCESLKTAVIGNRVETIGTGAFYSCRNLQSVNVPRSVREIGASAFSQCESLQEIVIRNNVTTIGEFLFQECAPTIYTEAGSAIEKFGRENQMTVSTNIGSRDTESHETDVEIRLQTGDQFWLAWIPDQGTDTDGYLFEMKDDGTLRFLFYRGTRTSIGISAAIGSLRVTSIGNSAFYNPMKLKEAYIGEGITELEYMALYYNANGWPVNVTLPSSIVKIDEYGCGLPEYAASLTVVRGSYVDQYLQQNGFVGYYYTDGGRLTPTPSPEPTPTPTPVPDATPLPAGSPSYMRLFGTWVSGKTRLTFEEDSLTINETTYPIQYNDYGMFSAQDPIRGLGAATIHWRIEKDNRLRTYYMLQDDPDTGDIYWEKEDGRIPAISTYAPGETPVPTKTPEPTPVPDQFEYSVEGGTATLIQYNGTEEKVVVPDTFEGLAVTAIGPNAFKNNESIREVILPDSVSEIGRAAFWGCVNMSRISVPSGLQAIREMAFGNCTSLRDYQFPESLTVLEHGAFEHCESLKEIVIPATIREFGARIFGNAGLEKATIQDGIDQVPEGMFSRCKQLKVITIPENVTAIGAGAFTGCESLREFSIPQGVKVIGKETFQDCSNLERVDMPQELTEIGDSAFARCEKLGAIDIPPYVTKIGDNAFAYCRIASGSVRIPDGVSRIGAGMFSGDACLTQIVIPEGVTVIETNAFMYCKGLQSVNIPESVTEIQNYAFSGCAALTELRIPAGVTTFGKHVFDGTSSLTLTVTAGSPAEQYCRENQLAYTAGY